MARRGNRRRFLVTCSRKSQLPRRRERGREGGIFSNALFRALRRIADLKLGFRRREAALNSANLQPSRLIDRTANQLTHRDQTASAKPREERDLAINRERDRAAARGRARRRPSSGTSGRGEGKKPLLSLGVGRESIILRRFDGIPERKSAPDDLSLMYGSRYAVFVARSPPRGNRAEKGGNKANRERERERERETCTRARCITTDRISRASREESLLHPHLAPLSRCHVPAFKPRAGSRLPLPPPPPSRA